MCKRCHGFYDALAKNYPNAKIFALTPIWRKDLSKETDFGDFCKVKKDISRWRQ